MLLLVWCAGKRDNVLDVVAGAHDGDVLDVGIAEAALLEQCLAARVIQRPAPQFLVLLHYVDLAVQTLERLEDRRRAQFEIEDQVRRVEADEPPALVEHEVTVIAVAKRLSLRLGEATPG